MAEVHAFRGWRYDIAQVGSLSDVTAPPYDVINSDQQKQLYEQHPCNVVRLILNRTEPGDGRPDERYARAAEFLRRWQAEGILIQEREEAFYVYHQEFEWEQQRYVRKGFLGRLRLEEFGEGNVFPHEQTFSGPKADRLELTRACRTNLSPIFGLYPDNGAQVQEPLEKAVASVTPLEAVDELDVVHRFWPVTELSAINAVRQRLREQPIFIADGHHRYETALNYRSWLREEGRLEGETAAPNFMLMHFVAMNDSGLAILPTHRLVSGVPDLSSEELKSILAAHFELETVGTGDAAARETWARMENDGGQDVFGFGTARDKTWLLARLADSSPMATLAPDQSEGWRSLGVSVLHRMFLEHLLRQKFPESEPTCRYVRSLDEVISAQTEETCPLSCLVAPAGIEHVQEIASKFERMPQKSTYFYPKLLSGLVFNPLD
jgi:uncharacterized protein (DUF1015 family)